MMMIKTINLAKIMGMKGYCCRCENAADDSVEGVQVQLMSMGI